MNEELQSTNEELVTSKELQSTNEELTTLNAQLQEKIQELAVVNEDLANLLVSTDIVTVFWTPISVSSASRQLRRNCSACCHPTSGGRSRTSPQPCWTSTSPPPRAQVLATLAPIEREVAAPSDRQFVLRLLPYRASDNSVKGVVLTLVDVTALGRLSGSSARRRRRCPPTCAACPACTT